MRGILKNGVLVLVLTLLVACAPAPKKSSARGGDDRSPAEVNTQLGIQYMRNGMYEASLEKFKKAIAQDPRLPAAHSSIAVLYEQLGENRLADKHYRKAYNLDNSNPVTLNNYGQYLCRSGKMKEADVMFRKALEDPLYQNPEVVLTNAGVCAAEGGDVEMAEKYFRQALKRNAGFRPALQQMVRVSFDKQHYLATRAYLQRLQEVAPLSPELLWVGVRAEAELGDRNASSSYALLLKNKYPESSQAQALIEWERN